MKSKERESASSRARVGSAGSEAGTPAGAAEDRGVRLAAMTGRDQAGRPGTHHYGGGYRAGPRPQPESKASKKDPDCGLSAIATVRCRTGSC